MFIWDLIKIVTVLTQVYKVVDSIDAYSDGVDQLLRVKRQAPQQQPPPSYLRRQPNNLRQPPYSGRVPPGGRQYPVPPNSRQYPPPSGSSVRPGSQQRPGPRPRPMLPFGPPQLGNVHGGYQKSSTRPGEISINFINKSGRRINLVRSLPFGHETRFQFALRPNEPRRVSVRPDSSFWQAYDLTTRFPLYINGRHHLETSFLIYGTNLDARISSPNLRPEPVKRDRSVPRFIETQVVVDKSMLDHHGDEGKALNFTIMLMNAVTRTFLDNTFTAPVYVSVVNIHIMKEKPTYYRIVTNRPEISVPAACRYSREMARNHSIDFSLILTREDIGPSGFAAMYTMCSRRSCALVKENGPDTSFVITHEIAHALGIDHDEDDGCGKSLVSKTNIMVKKLFATSSNFRWSRCSAKMVWQNLKYFPCLKNKPKLLPAFQESMNHLPGELMGIQEQCRSYHGSAAIPCTPRNPLTTCRYLWCRPNKRAPCQPVWWHAPLEGSACARGRWCKRGRCIKKIKIVPVDGGWSDFSEFSPPCNAQSKAWVVQERNRNCTNPRPKLSGKKCQGMVKQFRVLLPTKRGICKPYTTKNLVLNDGMNLASIQRDGCIDKKDNITKWRVYRDTEQEKQVNSMNLTCNFESNGCQWQSSKQGVKSWYIGRGRTPSANTGPSFDHTFKNASGNYLYFETSWTSGVGTPLKQGSRIILESPVILSSKVCLTFAYHMYGRSIGSLEVYIRKGKHSRKMWSTKGNKEDKWHTAEIELAINIEYKITIEAVRGNSYYSDIAIDDIALNYGLCKAKLTRDEKQRCTNVCINEKNTEMIRRKLPDGYPCKLPDSKNNVCFKQVCQPVNCQGIINGQKC